MRLALCALREKGILDTVRVSWKRTCLCLPSALKVCKHILYAIAVTASLYGQILAFNIARLFSINSSDFFPILFPACW